MATESIEERLPPHNEDAEMSLLGSLLIDPDAVSYVMRIIKSPDDFYITHHKWIYDAIIAMWYNGDPIDAVSVGIELAKREKMEYVGPQYLYDLVGETLTSSNAEWYAGVVRDMAERRNILNTASRLAKVAYDEGLSREELSKRITDSMVELSDIHSPTSKTLDSSSMSSEFLSLIDDIVDGVAAPRVPTGMGKLDELLYGGWAKQTLYTVFGRPSTGKSLVAMWWGLHAARVGRPTLIFSLEMTKTELMERWVSALIGIPIKAVPQRLRNSSALMSPGIKAVVDRSEIVKISGRSPQTIKEAILLASGYIGTLPLEVNDHYDLSVPEIFGEVLSRRTKPELVIVDHILELDLGGEQTVSAIERGFNGLRKVCRGADTAVIVVSQANRRSESAEDKKVGMADLFMAGEKPSNVLIGLNREADDDGTIPVQPMTVSVPKNRGGPRGSFEIMVNFSTSSIIAPANVGTENAF